MNNQPIYVIVQTPAQYHFNNGLNIVIDFILSHLNLYPSHLNLYPYVIGAMIGVFLVLYLKLKD